MAGNKAGGLKASASNKARYGDDFYKKIGRKGGEISTGGGFAKNRELAVLAGRKGGVASRNTKELCLRGHRLEGDNIRIYTLPSGKLGRRCIGCERVRTAESRARKELLS